MLAFIHSRGGNAFFIYIPFFWVIGALYKPLMEGSKGQTLGKMAVGIKVVRAVDGSRINYGEAFLRWLIAALFGLISIGSLVDHLWPLWDENKQTLHDKVAKTIVVVA